MFKTRDELLAAIAKALTSTPSKDDQINIAKSAVELKLADEVPAAIWKGADMKKPPVTGEPDTDDIKGKLKKALAITELTGVEKAFYDGLKTDTAKDAFLAKSATDRATDITKAAGDDPVVYTTMDGTDIRKSAGDLVLSLAKRADASDRNLAVEKAARLDADLTKRAETDISKMAGDVGTRKALLKAVDGIADSTVRAEVMKSLTAANKAMSGAFTRVGSNGSPEDLEKAAETPEAAEGKLDELAKSLQKADTKLDYAAAYTQALNSPEGRQLYKAMQPQ